MCLLLKACKLKFRHDRNALFSDLSLVSLIKSLHFLRSSETAVSIHNSQGVEEAYGSINIGINNEKIYKI